MQYKTLFIICFSLFFSHLIFAQTKAEKDTTQLPVIEYSNTNLKYEIAEIKVTGASNYEDFVLIGFSGLAVGDQVEVPGDAITNAVKRFWKQGLFSDVKIKATKMKDHKVWLLIELKERPKVSELNFSGLKKSEKEDLEQKIGIVKGNQITPNISDRAKQVVSKFMEDKGYLNVAVDVFQKNDPSKPGYVIVDINVDKKQKTKVRKIIVNGNKSLTTAQIDKAMKKTNAASWKNFFRSKKFIRDEYEKDKGLVIEKYNEIGYRDAYLKSDSVVKVDDKHVDVYLSVDEGRKYYFRDIKWVGNTIYPYFELNNILNIKKGDVYNHKLLMEHLETDENTAVSKLYRDRGYLFFQVDPVEVNTSNDSIDLEMRMYEGKPATINEITIKGNTRVYEHIVRRELRTKPGQLYSQEAIMRSLRELAQMGHFDPEKLRPDIQPDQENGTVDIAYNLETKGSDQVEFSAGWGSTGIVGSVGLKFSNFAIQNLFRPSTYRIVPQGEGQTFSINAKTNGKSYTSFSLSFLEPWLGGKRPNSFSATLYYSTQSAMSSRYTSSLSNYYSNYYSSYYNNSYGSSYNYNSEIDPERYMRTIGASFGYGKRLSWPDDYFQFYGELSYQLYLLSNWYAGYFPMTNGSFNNISMNFVLSRSSIDNPIYTRTGSAFSLGLKVTPPYSLFRDKNINYTDWTAADRYRWVEYNKWTFSGKTYTPVTADNKLVIMTRAMFSYLGYYNKQLKSPFEAFSMGGDGMSSYTTYGTDYIPMRGYSSASLTPYNYETGTQMGYLYNKFTMEVHYPLSLEQSATIYILGFAEAGNCYTSLRKNKYSDGYNPFNLKRSAGVGVRIFLPMFGMMGIDWGYGFDKDVTGAKSGSQFHFVLGQEL